MADLCICGLPTSRSFNSQSDKFSERGGIIILIEKRNIYVHGSHYEHLCFSWVNRNSQVGVTVKWLGVGICFFSSCVQPLIIIINSVKRMGIMRKNTKLWKLIDLNISIRVLNWCPLEIIITVEWVDDMKHGTNYLFSIFPAHFFGIKPDEIGLSKVTDCR